MTNERIASDYALWGEYVDSANTMTEAEFDATSMDDGLALMRKCFGPFYRIRAQYAGNDPSGGADLDDTYVLGDWEDATTFATQEAAQAAIDNATDLSDEFSYFVEKAP